MVVPLEPLVLESGERLQGEIKYYDYGVLSVVFELPFAGGWEKLTGLASRWVWDVDFAAQATAIVRASLERAAPALIKPYDEWLSEDYLIFHVREISRLALGHRADSSARLAHRAGGARRHRPTGRERMQRGAAIAHFLLCQRSGGDRLERGLPL